VSRASAHDRALRDPSVEAQEPTQVADGRAEQIAVGDPLEAGDQFEPEQRWVQQRDGAGAGPPARALDIVCLQRQGYAPDKVLEVYSSLSLVRLPGEALGALVAGRFPLFTDACVNGNMVEALITQGWDVVRAIELHPERTPDPVVFARAADEGRVLVSNDGPIERGSSAPNDDEAERPAARPARGRDRGRALAGAVHQVRRRLGLRLRHRGGHRPRADEQPSFLDRARSRWSPGGRR